MNKLSKVCFFAACIIMGSTAYAAPTTAGKVPYKLVNATTHRWQNFYAVKNNFRVSFPETPEHLQQTVSSQDAQVDMNYNVYISANKSSEVYMVLVATYPDFVDSSYAEISLETFINGMLHQHPGNKLVYADIIETQGFKALDFSIVSQDNICFQGRAIMANNQLYLLAMEVDMNSYIESNYNYFINSFSFVD